MTTYQYHLGIDLHKKTSFWTILDNEQRVLYRKNLATSQAGVLRGLRESRVDPGLMQAAIEPVSQWAWYGELLRDHGVSVHLVNPYKTKLISQTKLKNDKVDSRILAELLRCGFLPTSYYAPQDVRKLRELTRWRLFLSRLRTRLKNRVHQILAKEGVYSTWSDPFGKGGRQFILSLSLPTNVKAEIDQWMEYLDQLDRSIAERDRAFKEYLALHPETKILLSIPGMGPVTVLMMLAEIGDYKRFPRPEQLVAFAGLNPSSYASGEHIRQGRITRHGSEHLRTILVEAAHRVRPTWGSLYDFHRRIREKKGSKIASVALARKLLVLSWHLMRKQELYRPIPTGHDSVKR